MLRFVLLSMVTGLWSLATILGLSTVMSFAGATTANAVECVETPHDRGGTTPTDWIMDADNGTCGTFALLGVPANGFSIRTLANGVQLHIRWGSGAFANAFINCTTNISSPTAGGMATLQNLCASGEDRATVSAAGSHDYDIIFTFEQPVTGNIYTVTVNTTIDLNSNFIVNSMSVTSGEFGPGITTEEQLANFSVNRATNLLNNQPQIGEFLRDGAGGGSNPFGALSAYGSTSFNGADFKMSYANSVSRVARLSQNRVEQAMAAAYKQQPAKTAEPFQHLLAYGDDGAAETSAERDRVWDAWVQVYGAHSESGDTSTDFWVGYAGAHYFVTPDMTIGALAQIDYANEDNSVTGSDADGLGWMIGPYLAAKLPDAPLYFEARVAWGQSNNSIAPTGGAEDDFDTTRWLASAKLSGEFKLKSITISPSVRASYYNEKQHSYVDSTSTTIASQSIEVGGLRWGPTFSTTIITDDGVVITPSLGVQGVWNFAVDEAVSTAGTLPGTDDLRSSVDAGLGVASANGLAFNLEGFYDGIGLDDFEAYGGTARVSVAIQ